MTSLPQFEVPSTNKLSDRWKRYSSGATFRIGASILALAVSALVIYPFTVTWWKVIASDQGLGGAVTAVLNQRNLGMILRNTVIIVVVAVSLATVIGSAFAWINERTDASIGWVSRTLPILPLLVPPIAGAAGWYVLGAPRSGFGNAGIRAFLGIFGVEMDTGPFNIQSWYGMTFVYMLYLVPLVYLSVSAALRNVDPSLEEASRTSGATPGVTARTVTLPSVMPAIGAGMLLSLIYAFSLFSIPALLGRGTEQVEVLSYRIVALMRVFPPRTGEAMVLGVVMFAVIGTGLWLQRRVIRKSRFATISGRSKPITPIRMGRWKWPVRIAMIGYFVITAIMPTVGLLIVAAQPFWTATIDFSVMSLERFGELLGGGTVGFTALKNSVTLAFGGALLGMFIASVVSTYSNRRMDSNIGRFADFSTKLPGAVSNILIGVSFVAAFAGPPFGLSGTMLILLLAYLVITMPQASFSASAAHAQVGRDLEEASRASGATETRTFFRVTLPLMIPGLAAGWAQVFVLMAGDITASSMLASQNNPVVGSFMLDQADFGSWGTLTTVAIGLVVASTLIVFTGMALARRFGALGKASR